MRRTLKRIIGRAYLRASGWETEGERPSAPAFVLIAAPHTSNWDMPIALAVSFAYELPMRWAGKHTLFRWPYGWLFEALGGIPIVRDERGDRVHKLASLFDEHAGFVLGMPAEGTRGRAEHWKSGFYHIAQEAGVPIVCGYLDYERKRGGLGLVIEPTGDIHADMDRIRAFYADKVGKHPEKFGPVRLREELDATDETPESRDPPKR